MWRRFDCLDGMMVKAGPVCIGPAFLCIEMFCFASGGHCVEPKGTGGEPNSPLVPLAPPAGSGKQTYERKKQSGREKNNPGEKKTIRERKKQSGREQPPPGFKKNNPGEKKTPSRIQKEESGRANPSRIQKNYLCVSNATRKGISLHTLPSARSTSPAEQSSARPATPSRWPLRPARSRRDSCRR